MRKAEALKLRISEFRAKMRDAGAAFEQIVDTLGRKDTTEERAARAAFTSFDKLLEDLLRQPKPQTKPTAKEKK